MGETLARPVNPDDLTIGTPILVSGLPSTADYEFQRAEVIDIRREEVKARDEHGRRAATAPVVGHVYEIKYRTIFGNESTKRMFDSMEALDAEYPPTVTDKMNTWMVEHRQKYLDEIVTRSPLRIEDPDGAPVTVIDTWGSRVTTSVFIPDVDHHEAAEKIRAAILSVYPDARLPKLQAQPVADIRVDVWESIDTGDQPVAMNVLQAESSYYARGGTHSVRRVPPGRVVGT